MRRLLCSLAVVASAVGIAAFATGVAAGAPNRSDAHTRSAATAPSHGVLIPSGPLSNAGGTVSSRNWSGYAVKSKKITGVESTFVVPTASKPPTGFAASWTGIGGYGTGDLIQAGVSASDQGSGGPQYNPWYELLPKSETRISKPVSPGDSMTVTITETSTNKWDISMDDSTAGWSWSKSVSYNSRRLSAEWILEAPTVNGGQSHLPSLSTAYFGPTSTYNVNGGSANPISAGKPVKILLVTNKGNREATPSKLALGQQFNDCAYQKTCMAP